MALVTSTTSVGLMFTRSQASRSEIVACNPCALASEKKRARRTLVVERVRLRFINGYLCACKTARLALPSWPLTCTEA